jgi:hypothetical protein
MGTPTVTAKTSQNPVSEWFPDADYSPGNKRLSRLFPVITDGVKRRPLLGSYRVMARIEILRVKLAAILTARGNLTDEVLPPQPISPVCQACPKF